MITVNGAPRSDHDLSVTALLATLQFDHRGIAVAMNGEIVPRGEWMTTVVVEGSIIEIVSAAAGG